MAARCPPGRADAGTVRDTPAPPPGSCSAIDGPRCCGCVTMTTAAITAAAATALPVATAAADRRCSRVTARRAMTRSPANIAMPSGKVPRQPARREARTACMTAPR
jgi:hypothetical protein